MPLGGMPNRRLMKLDKRSPAMAARSRSASKASARSPGRTFTTLLIFCNTTAKSEGEWPVGISPTGSRRTVREPLNSYGSHYSSREWLCFIQRLLPFLVDHQIKLSNSTPSLHPHYRTSSLLRVDPPLCSASALSPSRDFRLSFSLYIGTTGSRVPS